MDDELEPAEIGTVETRGPVEGPFHDAGRAKAKRLLEDVERHGEAHAAFQNVEQRVEVRLATAVFDFESHTIEIYDGDQYEPFGMDKLVTWEVPMAVYH